MAGSSVENFVPANLIGSGSRVILARMSAVEGCLLYGTVPDYFPSIEDRKLSIFGYDENGNPGFWNAEVVFSRVPYALEIDGTPVDGDIEYNVTGTVSYSTGLGVNSALPDTFQRIPDYNTKVAFSTTGGIFLDINDATDLPYGQGYYTGSQFRLELKTADGVSRFYGTSSGQIEDVTNWTAFTGETGANTINISPPTDVTVAAPGQMIESLSDVNSFWFRGNGGLRRVPEIDEFGFLRVNGMIPRSVTAAQLNNVPRAGEIVTLPDHNNCTAVGDGTNPVSSLRWEGKVIYRLTNEYLDGLGIANGDPFTLLTTLGQCEVVVMLDGDLYYPDGESDLPRISEITVPPWVSVTLLANTTQRALTPLNPTQGNIVSASGTSLGDTAAVSPNTGLTGFLRMIPNQIEEVPEFSFIVLASKNITYA